MTSGLEWNGLRDYNIFTMPDRVRDAIEPPPRHGSEASASWPSRSRA